MRSEKHPSEYGLSGGPMMVACQWKRSSPTGPALQSAGGSRRRSSSSFEIRLSAIFDADKSLSGQILRGAGGALLLRAPPSVRSLRLHRTAWCMVAIGMKKKKQKKTNF